MLTLRKAQMVELDATSRRRFEANLTEHLRRHYPDAAELPAQALQGFVANAVKIAQAHGLTWQSTIATFVSLMVAVSPRFFAAPPIAELLRDETLPPDLRLDRVLKLVPPEAWEAAAVPSFKQAAQDASRRASR
jgi:hypothetical protein